MIFSWLKISLPSPGSKIQNSTSSKVLMLNFVLSKQSNRDYTELHSTKKKSQRSMKLSWSKRKEKPFREKIELAADDRMPLLHFSYWAAELVLASHIQQRKCFEFQNNFRKGNGDDEEQKLANIRRTHQRMWCSSPAINYNIVLNFG